MPTNKKPDGSANSHTVTDGSANGYYAVTFGPDAIYALKQDVDGLTISSARNPYEDAEAKKEMFKKQVDDAVKKVTTGSMITQIRKVIPMELENKIHDLRERDSKLSWDYGNIANEIYRYMVANNLPYTRLEACGYLAAQVDNFRAPNTILRYAMVAEFFANKKAWERYDFLPFSHFELAMRMGDRWHEVLDKSAEPMAGQIGRPPSRARLEQIFCEQLVEHQMNQNISSMETYPQTNPVLGPSSSEADDVRNLLAQLLARLGLYRSDTRMQLRLLLRRQSSSSKQ